MINAMSGSNAYFGQMQGTRQGQGPPAGRFEQLDTDGNGGIDQAELQTVADKIAGKTGQEINIEEVSVTYDANNDGLLGQDEMQTMMMEMREKMGGPQGGRSQQQGLSAYQTEAQNDPASILLEMFAEQATEDQESYSPFDATV